LGKPSCDYGTDSDKPWAALSKSTSVSDIGTRSGAMAQQLAASARENRAFDCFSRGAWVKRETVRRQLAIMKRFQACAA
jgi:hypothetical protein